MSSSLVQACLAYEDGALEKLAKAHHDGMSLQITACDVASKLLCMVGTKLPRLDDTAAAEQLITVRLFVRLALCLPALIKSEGDCKTLFSPNVNITQLHADALLVIVHAFGRQQDKCMMLVKELQPLAGVIVATTGEKQAGPGWAGFTRELLLLAMLAAHPALAERALATECLRAVWMEYQRFSREDDFQQAGVSGPGSSPRERLIQDMRSELEQLMAHVVKYMPDVVFEVLSEVQLEPAGLISVPCSAPALLVETSDHHQPAQLSGYSANDLLFPWWADTRQHEDQGSVWRPVLYALVVYGGQGFLAHALLMLLCFITWAAASLILAPLVAAGALVAHVCPCAHTSDWEFQTSRRSLLGRMLFFAQSSAQSWCRATSSKAVPVQRHAPLIRHNAERVPVPHWASFKPACVLNPLLKAGSDKALVFKTPLLRAYIIHRWHHIGRFLLAAQLMEHMALMAIFIAYAVTTSRRLTDVLDAQDSDAECATRSEIGFMATLGIMTLESMYVDLVSKTACAGGVRESFWLLLDKLSSLLMLATIIYHSAGCTRSEVAWDWGHIWDWRAMAASQSLLLFLRLLYFSQAVPHVGSFAQMMLSVMRDMYPFMYVLCTVFVGFSVCFSVLTGAGADYMSDNTQRATQDFQGAVVAGSGEPVSITFFPSGTDMRLVADDSVGAVFMTMFTLIFGGLDTDYLGQSLGPRRVGVLWAFLKALYQVLVAIVLLNILIAIINSSYSQVDGMRAAIELRNKAVLIVKAEGLRDTNAWSLSALVFWILQTCGVGIAGGGTAGHAQGAKARAWEKWDTDINRKWMFMMDSKAQTSAESQHADEPAAPPSESSQQLAQLRQEVQTLQGMLTAIMQQLPALQQAAGVARVASTRGDGQATGLGQYPI